MNEKHDLKQQEYTEKLLEYNKDLTRHAELMKRLKDVQNNLKQNSQSFVQSFDEPLVTHRKGVIGKAILFAKRAIRKSTRFLLKPYAEKSYQYQVKTHETMESLVYFLESLGDVQIAAKALLSDKDNSLSSQLADAEKTEQDELADINSNTKQVADEISQWISFEGKKILEIGCGNGELLKYIVKNNSPEFITGIDPSLGDWWGTEESSGANWNILSGDAESLDFPDNSFDAVFSMFTFEHIGDVPKALSEIKRVLKPGGRFYTTVIPLWTSVFGHHFFAEGDSWWNEKHLALIPPWGHLYLSETEMKKHLLKQGADGLLAEKMIEFIYRSGIINRLSRSDLLCCIVDAGMVINKCEEILSFNRFEYSSADKISNKLDSEISEKIINRISKTKYNTHDLGVVGMRICLEKYESI